MACPTCEHTMQNLGVPEARYFWCPRCGTVRSVAPDGFENVSTPLLVGRCRRFEEECPPRRDWHWLGIEESIYRPEERQAP
jgi:hypothetical protein